MLSGPGSCSAFPHGYACRNGNSASERRIINPLSGEIGDITIAGNAIGAVAWRALHDDIANAVYRLRPSREGRCSQGKQRYCYANYPLPNAFALVGWLKQRFAQTFHDTPAPDQSYPPGSRPALSTPNRRTLVHTPRLTARTGPAFRTSPVRCNRTERLHAVRKAEFNRASGSRLASRSMSS